jgi:DNA integrity scanning protein DisA with diadenylate cyclase activity
MPKPSPIPELCCGLDVDERGIRAEAMQQVVLLAVEIAREGREGNRVGTLFTVGDVQAVLARSRCLILDPLLGHPDEVKHVNSPDMRETVKELAQLDGAFVLDGRGVVVSATRYLDSSSRGIVLPLGFGSRHMAAASITRETRAVAVVVSLSSMVRIFKDGGLITEILPEVWLLSRHGVHVPLPKPEIKAEDIALLTTEPDPAEG